MTAEELMTFALAEASKGSRAVRPNPKVGAALLSPEGKLVLGFHEKSGGLHAEAQVLKLCEEQGISTKGSTIAVTLEPCSHFGKTPPCADALIRSGVAKVYVGIEDSSAKVRGRGIEKLRSAGIFVQTGVLEKECEAINHEWLVAQAQGFPFTRIKMAMSLDGLWTTESGESRWITGSSARQHAHELRAEVDAIVTSSKTVLKDNPKLTARRKDGSLFDEQPKVFVFTRSKNFSLPSGSFLAQEQGVPSRVNLCVVEDLQKTLSLLLSAGINDLMVEAGPELSHAFLNSGLFNELWHYIGPRYLGGQGLRLKAFAQGCLPGLELSLKESHAFSEGDLCLKLVPSKP